VAKVVYHITVPCPPKTQTPNRDVSGYMPASKCLVVIASTRLYN